MSGEHFNPHVSIGVAPKDYLDKMNQPTTKSRNGINRSALREMLNLNSEVGRVAAIEFRPTFQGRQAMCR